MSEMPWLDPAKRAAYWQGWCDASKICFVVQVVIFVIWLVTR